MLRNIRITCPSCNETTEVISTGHDHTKARLPCHTCGRTWRTTIDQRHDTVIYEDELGLIRPIEETVEDA